MKKGNAKYEMPKWLKIVFVVCILIIVAELGYMGISMIQRARNTVYYDTTMMGDVDGDSFITVGSSDFKHSKYVDYMDGLVKGKLAKYTSDGKLIWEKTYQDGVSDFVHYDTKSQELICDEDVESKSFNSTFYAVKTLSDGYLVAGSAEFSEYQQQNQIREAILVKYDFDGNVLWSRRFKALSNTKFTNILVENDGYVVVGQSIYENLELGNHTIGGGIIVKYDLDGNVVWNSNFGGNKSGIFNDITKVSDGYIVVGKDSKDTGLVVKYNFAGERQWIRNYSYTDTEGFQGVVSNKDEYYVVGSKKIWEDTGDPEKDNARAATNTEALIVKYNSDGTQAWEKTFGGSSYERFYDVLLDGESLYLVGHFTSSDIDVPLKTKNSEMMTGLLVKMDLDGNIIAKNSFGGSNNDNLLNIVKNKDQYLVLGVSNSKDKDLKSYSFNGKDYHGILFAIDSSLNVIS